MSPYTITPVHPRRVCHTKKRKGDNYENKETDWNDANASKDDPRNGKYGGTNDETPNDETSGDQTSGTGTTHQAPSVNEDKRDASGRVHARPQEVKEGEEEGNKNSIRPDDLTCN